MPLQGINTEKPGAGLPCPSRFCIYSIRDQLGRPVYIGSTINLASRLSLHRSGKTSKAMAEWAQSLDYIPPIVVLAYCSGHDEMADIERALISALKPQFNVATSRRGEMMTYRGLPTSSRLMGHEAASCTRVT